jgi:ABC-type sugar transport system ATPase subunit
MSAAADAPVLEVRNAVKRFGAVLALDDVSFSLGRGEVLALLGDNGAGKSTLIKCISGAQPLDEGTILIDGRERSLKSSLDAHACGIETVYQDLALFDNLSVAANFFAGRELSRATPLGPLALMRRRAMTAEATDILRRLEVNVPNPRATVGLMSGGQRQAVAVARAVHFARRVVILDEPTAALGLRETRNVLRLVKKLPEEGISVILISHSLDQVMQVADRALVVRRGSKIGEAVPTKENHDRIVAMIIGAEGAAATT